MDFSIKCNNVKCRKPLDSEAKACVTICSHIFCTSCANKFFSTALVCPACESSLSEKNDIIITNLKPNETFKNSALAGLHPDVIIEICSKAFSFWSYQATQEIYCQEVMAKNLGERKALADKQLKDVISSANTEISLLHKKINSLQKEKELEKKKMNELSNQYSEKCRQYNKLQSIYDKLKRKQLAMSTKDSVNANFYNEGSILEGPLFTPTAIKNNSSSSQAPKFHEKVYKNTPYSKFERYKQNDRLTISPRNTISAKSNSDFINLITKDF